MANLKPKEIEIARRQVIQNVAVSMQSVLLDYKDMDIGIVVDASLMLIRSASKQCSSPEIRLDLLEALNETIQACAAMNHEVVQAMPPAPNSNLN